MVMSDNKDVMRKIQLLDRGTAPLLNRLLLLTALSLVAPPALSITWDVNALSLSGASARHVPAENLTGKVSDKKSSKTITSR